MSYKEQEDLRNEIVNLRVCWIQPEFVRACCLQLISLLLFSFISKSLTQDFFLLAALLSFFFGEIGPIAQICLFTILGLNFNETLQTQLAEAKECLQAASRLSDQLEKKSERIEELNQEGKLIVMHLNIVNIRFFLFSIAHGTWSFVFIIST